MNTNLERIAIILPGLLAATLILFLGNEFIKVNGAKFGFSGFSSRPNNQSDRLPSGLDANDVAKAFAGHWIVRSPPKKLPNGEVEKNEYGVTYKFTPTKTNHGTWTYDGGGNSGTWTIRPRDLMENNGVYRFLLNKTQRNELGSNLDTYIEQLTKTSCEVVSKFNGTEMGRSKATRQ